jgi:hypothetical protein
MSSRMLRGLAALCASILPVACAGGDSSSNDDPMVTADTRGILSGAPGGGSGTLFGGGPQPGLGSRDLTGQIAREIQEANLHQLDGDTLYLLNPHRGLTVVDLAAIALRGRLPLGGMPLEFYLDHGRALVLIAGWDGDTELLDVDLADPDQPALRSRETIPGAHRQSRRVGDVLYVVVDGGLRSFRIGSSLTPVAALALPLGAGFAHATDQRLAVAAAHPAGGTRIEVCDISDPGGAIVAVGGIDLPGFVADQEKLHQADGTLRVVTHDPVDGGLSHLFMIDPTAAGGPTVIGSLSLARGEQLFATRFTAEEAFLVTFEQVDPLWVIDLRDPRRPTVAGELTVPGWSTHLVPVGRRLIALGVDPSAEWRTTVSMFDVADPARPTLLSRLDFGAGWSSAFDDIRAFGVFPDAGLVLVPFAGAVDRLAVVRLGANRLELGGYVDATGAVLRGFPHPRGICAISTEEVVVADPQSLAVQGRATIAENTVDVGRLSDGRTVTLLQKGDAALLDGVSLPLVPECLHLHGDLAAVPGWDQTGRACYVVDLSRTPPRISPRLGLGAGWAIPLQHGVGGRGAAGAAVWPHGQGRSTPNDGALTGGGRLVVRSLPETGVDLTIGPAPFEDGFVVVDLPSGAVSARIAVGGGLVTGFALDGETLLLTRGRHAGFDRGGRPLMRSELYAVDLDALIASAPIAVPGAVLRRDGDLLFTLEERWGRHGHDFASQVVASRLADGASARIDSFELPQWSYDVRVAGATLFHTRDLGGAPGPGGTVSSGPPGAGSRAPSTAIGTVRLAAALAAGPQIDGAAEFGSLLLAEEGSALVQRNGTEVEAWDLRGRSALRTWRAAVGTWPVAARADGAARYLLALGYGGHVELP